MRWAAGRRRAGRCVPAPRGVPPDPRSLTRHQIPPVAHLGGRPLRALPRRQHPEPLVRLPPLLRLCQYTGVLLLLAPHGRAPRTTHTTRRFVWRRSSSTPKRRVHHRRAPRRRRLPASMARAVGRRDVAHRRLGVLPRRALDRGAAHSRRGLRVTRGELDAARPAVDRLRAVAARRALPPPPAPNDGAAAARRRGGGGRGRPEVRLGSRFTLEEIHVPDVIDTLVGRRSTRLSLQLSTPCPVPAPPARPRRLTRRALTG